MAGYYHSSQQPRWSATPAAPIRDAALVPAANLLVTNRQGSYHRYGNSANNQRLHVWRPPGPLEPIWQTDLPKNLTPEYVVAACGRVLVKAAEGWLLFDDFGQLLSHGATGAGDLTLDAEARLFYAVAETGNVGAFTLRSGAREFYLTPFFGGEFRRDFIHGVRGHVVIASVERERNSRVPPKMSVVEAQDVTARRETDVSGWLMSARRTDSLKRKTGTLRIAMSGDTVALAADDSLCFAEFPLHLQSEFTDIFRPLWLSMDEQKRCYMIFTAENGSALWIISQDGARVAVPLPEGMRATQPAAIGYDHSVYLVCGRQLLAIDARGALLWTKSEAEPIAGVAVTADGNLLITTGSNLVSYSRDATRECLLTLSDDRFTTAPAAGDNGELFIAGARRLYRVW